MGKVAVALSLFSVFFTIGVGVYCLTIDDSKLNSSPLWFRIFGVVALIYGVFRIIRIYQKYKSMNHEN